MSRRYGRKQRREARATIDMLCETLDANTALMQRSRLEIAKIRSDNDFLLDKIRNWDNEIKALLGPYTSFAIDDVTFRVNHPDQVREIPIKPPLSLFGVGSDIMKASCEQHFATMLMFFYDLSEHDLMTMRRYLSLRIKIGTDPTGQDAHYAFSEAMWQALRGNGDEALARTVHRITGDMVRLLAQPAARRRA